MRDAGNDDNHTFPTGFSEFLSSYAHDLKNRKAVGQWPEGGHDQQTEENILAIEKGRAQPEKMGNEDASAQPVQVMRLPS